jgi:tRNA pseudouridine55 synthase
VKDATGSAAPSRPACGRQPAGLHRSGVLVADKGAGVTSFDVVARLRQSLGVRRIGHAGTLDPDAVGVLPILIGEATKLMPYVADHDKAYHAVVRLGVVTDTQDMSGRVLATSPIPRLDRDVLERAVRPFVGRIAQVPPMYSAVHHEGRRLYELAREGRHVAREAREVTVSSIAVDAFDGATVTLSIVCGKGTYVRTLAADLGAALGCGGAVEHLVRTRVGPFSRANAVPWDEITAAARGALWDRVLPPEAALTGWPVVTLDAGSARAFVHGQPAEAALVTLGAARFVVVKDAAGVFLGVGERVSNAPLVRPARLLHADPPRPDVLPA